MNAYLKHLFIPKCGFLRSPFSCGNLYRRKLPNFVDASYNIPLRSRAEQRLAWKSKRNIFGVMGQVQRKKHIISASIDSI